MEAAQAPPTQLGWLQCLALYGGFCTCKRFRQPTRIVHGPKARDGGLLLPTMPLPPPQQRLIVQRAGAQSTLHGRPRGERAAGVRPALPRTGRGDPSRRRQVRHLFVRVVARDERIACRGETARRRLDPLGQFRDSGAARDPAAPVRSAAEAEAAPESPQRAGTRRPPLSVLRPAFSHASAEHRPRGAAEPRRRNHLGKRGLRLSGVQRQERRPHAARSPHETDLTPPSVPNATRCCC